MKNKIKTFYEENENLIKNVAFGVALGTCGIIGMSVGKRMAIPWGRSTRKRIENLLQSGPHGKYSVGTFFIDVTASELGKLSDTLKDLGAPEDLKIKRIITIGDPYK